MFVPVTIAGATLIHVRCAGGLRRVVIDTEDYQRVSKYPWRQSDDGFIVTGTGRASLARYILNKCESLADYPTNATHWATKVSHRNTNKFDFRKSNLIHRRHRQLDRGDAVKGYVKRGAKFRAQITFPGYGMPGKRVAQTKRLGSYATAADASKAYRYAVAWFDDGSPPPLDSVGLEVIRQMDGLGSRLSDKKLEKGKQITL